MTYTEQIIVWQVNEVPDYYGGVYEALVPATGAPTWADIQQASGNQVSILGGTPTEGVFNLLVNTKDGFTWKQGLVVQSRFGYIAIESISEDYRKRRISLQGNIVSFPANYNSLS
jgi:hypothetical protein